MNYLDLFSGIGGFALGASWAGMKFDHHYYSEVDDYASRVYQLRFPDAVPLGDIRKIRGADLPAGDWILSGGFPCQDISVAGKGAGLAGARSGLWYEYARLIGELRPRFAIMENVGALTHRGLDRVLGSLAEIGYDAEWQDIRASDVGAPHRRERIWIVAYPGLPEPQGRHEATEEQQSIRGGETRGQLAPCSHVAYPQSTGIRGLPIQQGGSQLTDPDSFRRSENLAVGVGQRLEKRKSESEDHGEKQPTTFGDGWWTTEPNVGRVAHGIPSRVDRLRCLGNAIVPQIAQMIFKEIKNAL